MPRRLPSAIAAAALAAGAAGCGNERQPPPDLRTPGPPLGSIPVDLPQAGLRFLAPAGWTQSPGQPPSVTTITTGEATIALFRYPRTEPLPTTVAEAERVVPELERAILTRDPTYRERRRKVLRVDGRPAVQVRGEITVSGRERTVRSTHVYAFGAELVVDQTAPDAQFARVDAQAFRPFLRSLRLRAPRG